MLTGGVAPWAAAELLPIVTGLDALYINHMSGLEMEIGTAEEVRRRFTGPIYTDLHSLFLEPPAGRPRLTRPLPHANRWLRTADVVQLNEVELGLLEQTGDDPFGAVRSGEPAAVLVTRGAAGADFVARLETDENLAFGGGPHPAGEMRSGRVPLPGGSLQGDPTGCGDIWGSVVFCGLLQDMPLPAAITRAHVAAAARIEHARMQGLAGAIEDALRDGSTPATQHPPESRILDPES